MGSASRQLDDAARRRLFWTVAPVVVLVIVAITQFAQNDVRPQRRGAAGRPVVAAPPTPAAPATTAPSTSTSADDDPPPVSPIAAMSPATQRRVVLRSRRFVATLLAIEAFGLDARSAKTLRQLAVPALARRITGRASRRGTGVAATVAGAELSDAPRAHDVVVAVTVTRSGVLHPVRVVLKRRGQAWLVASVT